FALCGMGVPPMKLGKRQEWFIRVRSVGNVHGQDARTTICFMWHGRPSHEGAKETGMIQPRRISWECSRAGCPCHEQTPAILNPPTFQLPLASFILKAHSVAIS